MTEEQDRFKHLLELYYTAAGSIGLVTGLSLLLHALYGDTVTWPHQQLVGVLFSIVSVLVLRKIWIGSQPGSQESTLS